MSAIPDKDALVQAIRKNVPEELLNQKIWLAYYYEKNNDGTYSKPPVKGYSVDPNKPSYMFDEVIQDGYPGIKINSSNRLVAFDVDDKKAKLGEETFSFDKIPAKLREFLTGSNTYTELSPSKCGVRSLFLTDSKEDLPGRANLIKELCLGGELFVNSGYVTVTGDKLFGTDVMHITKEEIQQFYNSNGHKPTAVDIFRADGNKSVPASLPKLNDVLYAIDCCKLDQSAIVKGAYKSILNQEYNHYDYWIKILAACHNYVSLAGQYEEHVLAHVIDWSRTDQESFQSEEDVITHWASFTEEPGKNTVTYNTLFKFARMMRFDWPKEKISKRGKPTGMPRVNEYANFKYLMEYYDLNVYHESNTNAFYVSGDEKIIKTYFTNEGTSTFFGKQGPFDIDTLTFSIWRMAQDNHYDNVSVGSLSQIAKAFVAHKTQTFNLMEDWLNTPYGELPQELKEPGTDPKFSNIGYLMSCIKFSPSMNLELAEIFLRAFFFGIAMPIYNPERIWPEHNFMLIFTGPENCRKSSFFSSLMPKQLADYLIIHSTETLSSDKSLRDFRIQLSSSAILVIDEFEIFYSPQNDSLFKNLVTSSSIDYTPIYSKSVVKAKRTAALAGSTNKEKLPIEQDSSRRLAIVDVLHIDTDALLKVNWHYFYNRFIERGRDLLEQGRYPWKLSQQAIEMQYQENEKYRSRNDLEILLTEAFDFDHEFPGLHVITNIQNPYAEDGTTQILYTRKEVTNALLQKNPSARTKPSALTNVLERLCGRYTKTQRGEKELPRCKGKVKKGVAIQGPHRRFIMPPRITDFVPEANMED
jgi:hypothetical protein